ncbi:hypothetical protein FACS1894172_18330 [Spirochaetia bacterium]|nr:hypothetical protein FACS1894164_03630 [Spirochaetia bacterium]GHU35948.1 hypothetical protein FACS1894172_18330 [Spirochaetia bacterium]
MTAVLESLFLYVVFFAPDLYTEPAGIIIFSVQQELSRVVLYGILIIYLLFRLKIIAPDMLKPHFNDIPACGLALVLLFLTGFCVGFFVQDFQMIKGPKGIIPVFVAILSCLLTGYAEEGFFRIYLLRNHSPCSIVYRMLIATVLFSLCHWYEGISGMLYAAAASLILSLISLKFRSLHGIALAHGLYDLIVWLN